MNLEYFSFLKKYVFHFCLWAQWTREPIGDQMNHFVLKTTKNMGKLYDTVVFRHLTACNVGEWCLREHKQMREVCNSLCFLLEKSFQEKRQGGETQTEPSSHPELKKGSWESRRVKISKICRAENHREVGWEVPPKSTANHWSACTCEENTKAKKKNH